MNDLKHIIKYFPNLPAPRKGFLWGHMEFLARWDQTLKLWSDESRYNNIEQYFEQYFGNYNKWKLSWRTESTKVLNSGFFLFVFFKNIFPKYKNREKLYIYKIIYICPLLYICTAIWNRNGYFILRMSENKLVLWIFFLRKTKYSQRLENIYVFKYELQVSILAWRAVPSVVPYY